MPGTHLLPPNLLKLFAPRPPLPYVRPVDKDIDRIREKKVDGVAAILQRLQDEKDDDLFNAAANNDDNMEEGEEPVFTLAEETKRQMRREERKAKKIEEFRKAKESCTLPNSQFSSGIVANALFCLQTNPLMTLRPSEIPIKHSSFHVWYVLSLPVPKDALTHHVRSIKAQRKPIYGANSRPMVPLNASGSCATRRVGAGDMHSLFTSENAT
jgi:hypothetical protein